MQFVEMYSYTTAGGRNKKRLQVHENTQSLNLDAAYTYDTEGKMASVSYPSGGNTYTYSFDSLDRPNTLTDQNSNQVVSNVQYNAASQILSMNYFSGSETRQYNSLGQVTSIVASGSTSLNRTYRYPTGTNNGKISSMTDNISGETVTYQYDSLNRLISAAGSGWGENYGYDSFGNLLSKTPTSGSPPTLSIAVNTANNQVVGYPYDANGNLQAAPSLGTSANLTYDADNRIVDAPGVQYGYDSQNKRVWVATLDSNGHLTGQTAYFYGEDGSMLAAYTLTLGSSLTASGGYSSVYFNAKRVGVAPNGSSYSSFIQDRLGSQGSYYPFGEDKGTPLPNDQFKYATYWRDSATSLDYADQRYYVNSFGRFMTADPYRASMDVKQPQSFDRYAFVWGDPINSADPSGLCILNGIQYPDGSSDCPDDISTTVNGDTQTVFVVFMSGSPGGGGGGGGGKGGHGPATCLAPLVAFNDMCVNQTQYLMLIAEQEQIQLQHCTNSFYNSSLGAIIQDISALTPFVSTSGNFDLGGLAGWGLLPFLKYLAVEFTDLLSQAFGGIDLISLSTGTTTNLLGEAGALAQAVESIGSGALVPLLSLGTAVDAGVRQICSQVPGFTF